MALLAALLLALILSALGTAVAMSGQTEVSVVRNHQRAAEARAAAATLRMKNVATEKRLLGAAITDGLSPEIRNLLRSKSRPRAADGFVNRGTKFDIECFVTAHAIPAAARVFTALPRVRLLVNESVSEEMKRTVLRIRPSSGFSLVELLVVVAVACIVMAVAVPSVTATMQSYALNSGTQIIASTVRSARLAAVSKNRQVRVLFNCPIAGQLRAVEVTGNAAIDNAADRCSTTTYPYPDPNPAAVPNIDGPVVVLPEGAQFGAFESVLIGTDGRVTPQTGCPAACVASAVPATVIISNTHDTRTITVAASGQVITP